ncbi:MAG: hypothetical protein K5989_03135 [Lachnospiraceae bacterium]|nr:hypothetical protein [Lachnospiraceae bacterium]
MEEKKGFSGEKISDEQAEKVSGGFLQTIPGFSCGQLIICPSCGNGNVGHFTCEELSDLGVDLYTCLDCNQQFTVAENGINQIL